MLKLSIPAIIFLLTIVLIVILLPDGCSLLSNESGPFMCHTIPLPPGCCTDKLGVVLPRIIAVLGIGLTIGSTIYAIRNASANSNDDELGGQ